MKVVWNTCDEELGGEMKFVNENYFKSSLENFQKSLSFREICVKYSKKNSVGILTAWKLSKYGVISGSYFPVFGLKTGKYGPEITPYLDKFHAVTGTGIDISI